MEAAIATYRTEVDAYFEKLEGETDPVAIAQHAGQRPVFPDLDAIGAQEPPAVPDAATQLADQGTRMIGVMALVAPDDEALAGLGRVERVGRN